MSGYVNFKTDFEPKRFDELVGQDETVAVIRTWFAEHRIPTFLLSGPVGVGKSLLAKMIVRSAICSGKKHGELEACGECRSCKFIPSGCYYSVGSRVVPDAFRDHLISARHGNQTFLSNEQSEWYAIWIDELHELPKQAMKDMRAELEQKWTGSIFIGTTSAPEKIDNALCDRFYPIEVLPPSRTIQNKWISGVCRKAGIKIEDTNAPGIISDVTKGHFRKSLTILQRIYDAGKVMNEDTVLRAVRSCGFK